MEHPDAVDLSLAKLVQELNYPARELPIGTPLINVYDAMGGTLLVLGAPGAGKTTLLLELARDLIMRAENDENQPIPVVFNLSSWAVKRQPLKNWLAEELNQRYDVPKKTAQGWVDAYALLPLLDGLDEVAVEHRSACAAAINSYRQENQGLMPLAVCSRLVDYEALTVKLRLQGAVLAQPLTHKQIHNYLEQAKDKTVGVRSVLRTDTELAEMLDTPLMLNMVVLAYADKSVAELLKLETTDDRRRHLFDAYISAMFKRRNRDLLYSEHQTIRRLSWLAGKMVSSNQTIYYVERMQPDWLTRSNQLSFILGIISISVMLGGLIIGLIGGFLGSLFDEQGRLFGGLGGGLLGGLFGAMCSYSMKIQLVEKLRWSWIAAGGGKRSSLLFAFTLGLISVPIFGQISRPFTAVGREAIGALGVGLFGGLGIGLSGWVFGWLVGEIAGEPTTAQKLLHNPLLYRLVRLIFVFGLVFGLSGGISNGMFSGLVGGWVGILDGALVGTLVFVLTTRNLPIRRVDYDRMRRVSWITLASGLTAGLTIGLATGWGNTPGNGVVGGLFGLLGVITFVWLSCWLSRYPTTEPAPQNTSLHRFARNSLSIALVLGMIGLLAGLTSGLGTGLATMLFCGQVGGLLGGLLSGLVEGDITIRTITNEGIRRSVRSAIVGGLVGGLYIGLIFGLVFELLGGLVIGMVFGLIGGLVGGLAGGLLYGGVTIFRHYTLRWVLYRKGYLPLRLIPFLDYCAERIFLRKVGGGYIFVHRLLMEHFASLYTEKPDQAK